MFKILSEITVKKNKIVVDVYRDKKEYYMMFPNGDVVMCKSVKEVQRRAKNYSNKITKGSDVVSVLAIEYRIKE